MTDRLEAIIGQIIEDTTGIFVGHTQLKRAAQRIRQALREEPVEAFGLRLHGTWAWSSASVELYALPQEEVGATK